MEKMIMKTKYVPEKIGFTNEEVVFLKILIRNQIQTRTLGGFANCFYVNFRELSSITLDEAGLENIESVIKMMNSFTNKKRVVRCYDAKTNKETCLKTHNLLSGYNIYIPKKDLSDEYFNELELEIHSEYDLLTILTNEY